MMAAIPIVLAILLGFGAASMLLVRDSSTGLMERLAMAYPLGIGLITMQMFLAGIAKVPLHLKVTAPLILFEVAGMALWVYRKKAVVFARNSGAPPVSDRSSKKYESLLEKLCAGWIAIKLVSVIFEASLRPIFSFDTFTNWSVRAKAFYYSSSLLLDTSAADFFGRGMSHSLGNFPPLNPLAQMWMAQWIGSFDEVLVKFWSPFFLVSAVAYLYLIAAKEIGRFLSLTIVVFFISSPLVSLHATESMSDLPLAVFILFAHYALLNVMRGRLAYLPMVGIFSALAMFIKAEGMIIALLLFLSCLVVLWQDSRRGDYSLRSVSARFLFPYLLAAPWLLFKLVHHLGLGPDPSSKALYFNPVIILEYAADFLSLQNFNVILLFIPILLILYGKLDREIVLMVAPIGLFALFFLSIYLFIAYYSDYSSGYSSNVFRNALTFYPSACLIVVLLVKRITAKKTMALS